MRRANRTRSRSDAGTHADLDLDAGEFSRRRLGELRFEGVGRIGREISGRGVTGKAVGGAPAQEIVDRDAQALADGVVKRDRNAAETGGHVVLQAEMIELVLDVGGDDLEIENAAADEERRQHRQVVAHYRQRASSLAMAEDPVIGFDRDQRAASPIVEAACHAIGLLGRHDEFERGHVEAADLGHGAAFGRPLPMLDGLDPAVHDPGREGAHWGHLLTFFSGNTMSSGARLQKRRRYPGTTALWLGGSERQLKLSRPKATMTWTLAVIIVVSIVSR